MRLFVKFFEALQNSQQLKADRVIRERYHLLEEARAHVRRREIEAASNNAGRVLQKSFTIGTQLFIPQIYLQTLSQNSKKMTFKPTAPSQMGGDKILENINP